MNKKENKKGSNKQTTTRKKTEKNNQLNIHIYEINKSDIG